MAVYRGGAGAELVLDIESMGDARRLQFETQIDKGDLTLVETPKPKAAKKSAPKPVPTDDTDSD